MLHARYNPEQMTALNIVPGLIGLVLTFSTLFDHRRCRSRVRRETGTMENLLAMPARPAEVMLGKIVPYIGLGYVQTLLILTDVCRWCSPCRCAGRCCCCWRRWACSSPATWRSGFTFSTLARTQMQAQQMAQFTLLPSFMLSGFMFPFQGMPVWARAIGELMPLTHALRICRGLLLKGNGLTEIFPDLWPMALFAAVVGVIAVRSYRETLD